MLEKNKRYKTENYQNILEKNKQYKTENHQHLLDKNKKYKAENYQKILRKNKQYKRKTYMKTFWVNICSTILSIMSMSYRKTYDTKLKIVKRQKLRTKITKHKSISQKVRLIGSSLMFKMDLTMFVLFAIDACTKDLLKCFIVGNITCQLSDTFMWHI